MNAMTGRRLTVVERLWSIVDAATEAAAARRTGVTEAIEHENRIARHDDSPADKADIPGEQGLKKRLRPAQVPRDVDAG